jgi:hypothetical protein
MEELTIEFVQEYLRIAQLDLYSTHAKVSFPILKRIHDKLKTGEKFKPICVDNKIIVDGHHRYICLHILSIKVEYVPWTRSHSIESTPWNQVKVVDEDWDIDNYSNV